MPGFEGESALSFTNTQEYQFDDNSDGWQSAASTTARKSQRIGQLVLLNYDHTLLNCSI